MKRKGPILAIYLIISATYIALSLILTTDKSSVFWTGLGFALISMLVTSVVLAVSMHKKSSAFPIEVSITAFSAIYLAVVFSINIICGYVLKAALNILVSVHVACLVLFSVIILLMFITKIGIIKQNNDVNGKICEMQILIYEFEKVKTKLIDMSDEPRKKGFLLIDGLLDELRFSDLGIAVDMSDIDYRLRTKAEVLSSEVDNLISIKSSDLTSLEASVNDIKKMIKDRNMQIGLMNSNV